MGERGMMDRRRALSILSDVKNGVTSVFKAADLLGYHDRAPHTEPELDENRLICLIKNLKRLGKDAFYLCELFGWGSTCAHDFWSKYDREYKG
jgi:hypothetical protein